MFAKPATGGFDASGQACRGRRPGTLVLGGLSALIVLGVGCGGPSTGGATDEASTVPKLVTAGEGQPFVDVTAAAGLDFVHHLGDATMDNIVESLGAGATWFDLDGDGDLDLYLLDQTWLEDVSTGEGPRREYRNRLWENLGDGTFRELADAAGAGDPGYSTAAVAADLDGDGRRDLFVANCGPNSLYLQRRSGLFERAEIGGVAGTDARCTAGATVFDLEGDGDLDLYLANYLDFDPGYTLHYAPDVYPGPLAYEAQPDVLLRNRGDGSFEDVTVEAGVDVSPGRGMGVVATDFDGDGRPDVFVANDGTANFLFRNLGGGRLEEIAAEAGVAFGFQGEATGAMAGVVGDVDDDGLPDLLVTDTTYGSLYRNLGGGLFEDVVMASGLAAPSGQWVSWGGGFFDADNDGDLDVFQVNGDLKRMTGRPDLFLVNRGDGSFELGEGGDYFRAELLGRGGAFADFDDDGDLDVLVTVLGGRAVLLRNDLEQGHWLAVELRGTTSNREGFGASVRLSAGGRERVRRHHAPTGYLTQGDPRLHFGLGDLDRVERLRVEWPSGIVDEVEDPGIDRRITIVEGEGEP